MSKNKASSKRLLLYIGTRRTCLSAESQKDTNTAHRRGFGCKIKKKKRKDKIITAKRRKTHTICPYSFPERNNYIVYGNKCFTFFTACQVVAIQESTVLDPAVWREECEAFLWTREERMTDALHNSRTASFDLNGVRQLWIIIVRLFEWQNSIKSRGVSI